MVEIGRANRPDLYNLSYRKPEPFVPRRLRFEVPERISHTGAVLVPLDETAVESVAEQLRALDVEAVAICFLHAWTNPEHERRAAELLGKLLRGVEIVASHEVSAQWREYERTSTTVLSAYVKPTVASYLDHLRSGLEDKGVAGPLYAMRSSGGVSSFERAARGAHHAPRVRPRGRGDRRGRARPAARRTRCVDPGHWRHDGQDVGGPRRTRDDRDPASRRADPGDAPAIRSKPRSSRSSRSEPAAARSRGWTMPVASTSGPAARAPNPARRAMAEAARNPRSPTRTWSPDGSTPRTSSAARCRSTSTRRIEAWRGSAGGWA